jgi:uncharacterized protein YprB with RNaseH-like and TPR domain
VSAYVLDAGMPLGLFDPRSASAAPDWASRAVFFDLETTGLSGGAGTLAFLVGCGWFEPDGFRVRQFLLTSAAGEPAMLDAVGQLLGAATLLVSYNGRTFDAPLMEMRWAFHRKCNPIAEVPHFDMLPSARRLWGRRDAVRSVDSPLHSPDCSLSSIERAILGFHRTDDVPGFEIPSRYFQFLRSGDESLLDGVLEHNRHDLLSLAGVTSHALVLAREGPGSCRDSEEQIALGRLYERAGELARARTAYEHAASAGDRGTRQHALAQLAVLLRRGKRFHESADAWRRVLDLAGGAAPGGRRLTSIERQAVEALAIHHEHRARDLAEAKRYAEAMGNQAQGAEAAEVAHRLARLSRKIEQDIVGRIRELPENTTGGLEAVPLLKIRRGGPSGPPF